MKKISFMLALLLLAQMFSVFSSADGVTSVMTGDVDGDRFVATPRDAMMLARYLAGWQGYEEKIVLSAADIDRDESVTLKDAIILARHIAGWGGYDAYFNKSGIHYLNLDASGDKDVINVMTSETGVLYWYYTNSGGVTAEDFPGMYDGASPYVKGWYYVDAGTEKSLTLLTSDKAEEYDYIVYCLYANGAYYDPETIPTAHGDSGFEDAPVWRSVDGNETLSFTAKRAGTVKFFYTSSAAPLSAGDFNSLYGVSGTYYNELPVTEGENVLTLRTEVPKTTITTAMMDAQGYEYIAVMFTDGTNNDIYLVNRRDLSKSGIYPGTTVTVNTSGSRDKLNITPNQSAVLFWYYTNLDIAPSAENYRANYDRASSNIKGYQTLDQVKSYSVDMAASNVAPQYNNIVICLYSNQNYFTPIIISRPKSNITNTSGFTTAPKVITSQLTNLDTLAFVPSESGTVYYYYTQSSSYVDITHFSTNYSGTASGLRGTISVIAGNNYSLTTNYNPSTLGTDFNYVAVMLSSNGVNYHPIITKRNASENNTVSGLYDVPGWASYNGNEAMMFNSMISGTMRFYFSASSTVPTVQTFMSYYGMNGEYYNSIEIIQGSNNKYLTTTVINDDGTTKQENIKTSVVNASNLGYIVLMLTDNSGKNYKPYVVPRQDTNETDGGFKEKPTVTVGVQNDIISFTSSMNGNVFWYYSTSGVGVSSDSFMTNWNNALTIIRGASGQVSANTAQSIQGALSISLTSFSSYNYVVIALQDSTGKFHTPIVVTRKQSTNSTYGFIVAPTVATYVSGNDVMSLTPQYTGTVYYYYSNSATSISNYNTFISNYNTASVKGSFNLTAGTAVAVNTVAFANVNSSLNYVVVMLQDSNGVLYAPYTVRRVAIETEEGLLIDTEVSLNVSNNHDILTISPSKKDSVLFWYYTNESTLPAANNYRGIYDNSSVNAKGYQILGQIKKYDNINLLTIDYASQYKYIIMCLFSDQEYKKPFIVTRSFFASIVASESELTTEQNVTLTANIEGGISPYTYLWEINDGYGWSNPVSGNGESTFTFIPTKTTQVRCYITDGNGINYLTNTLTINYVIPLELSISPNGSTVLNVGDSINVYASPSGGKESYSYKWEYSDDGGKSYSTLNSTTNYQRITCINAGTVYVRCTVTSGDESKTEYLTVDIYNHITTTINATVNEEVSETIYFSDFDLSSDFSEQILISDNNLSYYGLNASFDSESIKIEGTPKRSATFKYRMLLTTTEGTKYYFDIIISIAISETFTLDLNPISKNIKIGEYCNIRATPSGGSGNYNYSWYIDDSGVSVLQYASSYTFSLSDVGDHIIKCVLIDSITNKTITAFCNITVS